MLPAAGAGYLGYLAGLVGAEAPAAGSAEPARSDRRRVAGAALLFVAGFTVVFAAGVLLVLGLSDLLIQNLLLLQRIGGVVTIAMGFVFLGFVPALQREARPRVRPRGGLAAAPPLGAVYGLGWTPCLGPTLTGLIALASGTQIGSTTLRGSILVLAYCLGLGLPFVLLALGTSWAARTTGWFAATSKHCKLPAASCCSCSVACSSAACGESSSHGCADPSPASPCRCEVRGSGRRRASRQQVGVERAPRDLLAEGASARRARRGT